MHIHYRFFVFLCDDSLLCINIIVSAELCSVWCWQYPLPKSIVKPNNVWKDYFNLYSIYNWSRYERNDRISIILKNGMYTTTIFQTISDKISIRCKFSKIFWYLFWFQTFKEKILVNDLGNRLFTLLFSCSLEII